MKQILMNLWKNIEYMCKAKQFCQDWIWLYVWLISQSIVGIYSIYLNICSCMKLRHCEEECLLQV